MENELLSAEEKVLQHYLNIMNRSEVGSEEHTKALKGYMELKDRVIQSKRIEHEKYYKDRELELKEKQLENDKSNNKKSLVIESLKTVVPISLFIGNCIFQSIWIKRLNEFETTGTYTYTSSKRLIDSIFNFKK